MSRTDLLIVGSPFSGVSLLGANLAAHPDVFLAGELSRLHSDRGTKPHCPSCAPEGQCPVWDRPAVREAIARGPAALYAALGAATRARVIVDTSRTAEWAIARLMEALPGQDLRLVLCTCDPVLYTRKRQSLTRETPALCAAHWRNQNETLLQAAIALGRPTLTLRYDEIAYDGAAALRRVREFTGLAADDRHSDPTRALAHAIGGLRDSWYGESAPAVRVAAPAAGSARVVECFATLDADAADTLGTAAVREIAQALEGTTLPALLGYVVALPVHRSPASEAERRRMATWVNRDLAAARDALIERRVDEAIQRLRLLADHFGARFDEVQADVDGATLHTVLIQTLRDAGRPADAVEYAEHLVTLRPESIDARRLLAGTLGAAGNAEGALAAHGDLLRLAVASGATPDLGSEIADLLRQVHPDQRGLPEFIALVASQATVAAEVDQALAAQLEATHAAGVFAALGLLRAACGAGDQAVRLLEDGLTYHSRSTIVQAALFSVLAARNPDEPRYRLRGRFCPKPFENIELLPDGSAHACCAVWVPEPIGNVYQARRYEEVWNSELAQEMRRSILDGSYRYCNKLSCTTIQNNALMTIEQAREKDPRWREVIDHERVVLPFAPETVNLSYDRSCNLSCPSCRTHVIQSKDAERSRMDEMTDRIVLPLLEGTRIVTITGSGDPFGSRTFRRLLTRLGEMDYPNLRYHIATNGQLLTAETWDQFPKLKERVLHLTVSVDAATPDTYRILRRPGELAKLIPNLKHMGHLFRDGVLQTFSLAFVVQVQNYREMPEFVRFAKEVGAHHVIFQRLHNWDTFSREEYAKRAVFHEEHPEYEEFQRVLQDPMLRDPIVNLGMLRSFVRPQSPEGETVEVRAA